MNSGTVLYHSWIKKTPTEVSHQEEVRRAKALAKASRRQLHELRRLANESARATHREACLKGMRKPDEEAKPEGVEEGGLDSDMHQVSSDEAEEEMEEKAIEEKQKIPLSGDVGRITKRKNKTKKKNGSQIAKKHPAYNYLTRKAESECCYCCDR